jgi:hypothetical protein
VLRENDVVRLKHSVSARASAPWPGVEAVDLKAGAIGSVVAVYDTGTSEHEYEIEFVDDDGSTLALITVKESAIERTEG